MLLMLVLNLLLLSLLLNLLLLPAADAATKINQLQHFTATVSLAVCQDYGML